MNETLTTLQERAREGDSQAERELFDRLGARFRLFARQRIRCQEDCEDIVQEALKTVFEKYRTVEFETSFTAWAYRVLTNKIMTHVRSSGVRNRAREQIEAENSAAPQGDDDELLETRLLDCLRKLHAGFPRHARVLNLTYQGFDVSEICRRMNLTRTNLYAILSRARSKLQRCLEEGDVE